MARQIVKLRRGTKEDWKQYEIIKPEESMPLEGELVIEYEDITDNDGNIIKRIPRLKIGDGSTPYSQLPYMSIDSFVTPNKSTVTIKGGANNWEMASDNRYYQTVTVDNATITLRSKVDLQVDSEQLAIFREKGLSFVAENIDGEVLIFCVGKIPQNDYTIQVTVTEVTVNE